MHIRHAIRNRMLYENTFISDINHNYNIFNTRKGLENEFQSPVFCWGGDADMVSLSKSLQFSKQASLFLCLFFISSQVMKHQSIFSFDIWPCLSEKLIFPPQITPYWFGRKSDTIAETVYLRHGKLDGNVRQIPAYWKPEYF